MKKMIMALIIGCCFAVFSAGAAFAADSIEQKQQEVDQYVFEQHKDEVAAKGITVTHTSPMDGYVEIGITPFNEANADYLYGIFGKDQVKVVEGQQAVTLGGQETAVAEATPVAPVTQNESSNSLTLIYVVGGLIVVGAAAAYFTTKRRIAKR